MYVSLYLFKFSPRKEKHKCFSRILPRIHAAKKAQHKLAAMVVAETISMKQLNISHAFQRKVRSVITATWGEGCFHFGDVSGVVFEIWPNCGGRAFSRRLARDVSTAEQAFWVP